MKKNLLIVAVMVLAFVGCKPQVQDLEVKSEELSHKTSEWEISVKHSIFSSVNPEVKASCEVLNSEVEKVVNGLIDSLKAEASAFFKPYETDTAGRPVWTYELIVNDSVFMANEQYISLRLMTYTFTGGAHGMTDFYAFNYDVKNKRLLTNKEVIDYGKADAVNVLLKKNFKNPENCFSEEPTLDKVNAINWNGNTVCFTYAQYVLGAYACGYVQLDVPRGELKSNLLIH